MPPAVGNLWITGASTGIGRAVALRYLDAGWTVAASARGEADLASLAKDAEGRPGRLVVVPLDVTDHAAVAAAVARIEADAGPVDVAILNAGTHQPVTAERFSAATFQHLFDVNVMGTVNCLEALLPRLMARRRGQVAVVASVAGYRGLRTASAYGATKAALINMTEALKFDLGPHGIDMRLICPGFVRTPLTDKNPFPMPFLMEPEAAAERVFRGLAGTGFEITFPRRFTFILKLLRILPYRAYFVIAGKATGG